MTQLCTCSYLSICHAYGCIFLDERRLIVWMADKTVDIIKMKMTMKMRRCNMFGRENRMKMRQDFGQIVIFGHFQVENLFFFQKTHSKKIYTCHIDYSIFNCHMLPQRYREIKMKKQTKQNSHFTRGQIFWRTKFGNS